MSRDEYSAGSSTLRTEDLIANPKAMQASDWIRACAKLREENAVLRECLMVILANTEGKCTNLISSAIGWNKDQSKAEFDNSKLVSSLPRESHETSSYTRYSRKTRAPSSPTRPSSSQRSEVNNSAIDASLSSLTNVTRAEVNNGACLPTHGEYELYNNVPTRNKQVEGCKDNDSCNIHTRNRECDSSDVHVQNKGINCPNKDVSCCKCHTQNKSAICDIHSRTKPFDSCNVLPARGKYAQFSEVQKLGNTAKTDQLFMSGDRKNISSQSPRELTPKHLHDVTAPNSTDQRGTASASATEVNSSKEVSSPPMELKSNLKKGSSVSTDSKSASQSYVILGEIAFELERRILDFVFSLDDNQAVGERPRRHFYGFMVSNIRSMIPKQSKGPDGKFDPKRETQIRRRLDAIMITLGRLGYDMDKHSMQCEEIINKYGVFASVPHEAQIAEFGLDDADTLRHMVKLVACDVEEREKMLVLLECLLLLSEKDGRPILFSL